jgi:membrane associated rhomboid family serine protease
MSGIISFNVRLLTVSLIVALIYGGMFWGIFPIKPGISWESHLWGGISGFGLALLFRKTAPPNQRDQEEETDNDWVEADQFQPENESAEDNN